MAIPTISGVNPASGSTRGGNVVRIAGTNFRLPPPPPVDGPVLSDQQKTVSVKFQGVESAWAYSASSSLILARVPEWSGPYDITFPAPLNVRVANLDDAGVEIVGENVTLPAAYAITRPDLVAESYLQRVVREIIALFRRHVIANTHYSTGRDFSLSPSLQETLRASGPLLQLVGPTLVLNRFYSLNQEDPESDPLGGITGMRRRKPPVTVDLVLTVVPWANNEGHLHALVQALMLFGRDIKFVRVAVDPLDLSKGTKDYEFEPEWDSFPEMNSDPTADDLVYSVSRCVVRGVHVDEDFGTIVERGWIITDNSGMPRLDFQAP
jgi:hypothetical protein